jgi:death-on-curing family protein
MRHLNLEEIVEMNKEVGATGALMNRGNLEFVLASIKDSKDIIKCATAILHGIITLHVFLDGNKRTAFMAMVTFLKINGKSIKMSRKDAEKLVSDIAKDKYNKEEVENIIEKLIA